MKEFFFKSELYDQLFFLLTFLQTCTS